MINMIWIAIPFGMGAVVAVLWVRSTHQAAARQRMEDAAEMRAARLQAQTANANAQGWREAAHRHEVEIAYLHGMAAGRNYAEERRLPAPEKPVEADGEVFVRRPPVGRAG